MEKPMSLIRWFATTALALTLSGPGISYADGHEHSDAPRSERRAEIEHRIQMKRVEVLTEALDLDEETATLLFDHLQAGDTKIKELHAKKLKAKRSLRRLFKAESVTDDEVDELMGTLAAVEIALTQTRKTQFVGLKSILSPTERLLFMVTQEKFDRDMKRRMREVRRQRKGDRPRRHRGHDGN
jgi:hypothetical protein